MRDPDKEYPELQEKEATVPTGLLPFLIAFLLYSISPFERLRRTQVTETKYMSQIN